MACKICGKNACIESFHSLEEQEEFETKTGRYAEETENPIIEHPDIQRLIKQAVLDGFKIKDLQAKNKRLEEALLRFGHHDSPCAAFIDDEVCPCICGFEQALKGKTNDNQTIT